MATKYAGENALRYFKSKLVALINAAKSAADSAQTTASSAAGAAATAQNTANSAVMAVNAEITRAKAAEKAATLAAWPVGSIYWTSSSSFAPSAAFGGVWRRVDLKILCAFDAGDAACMIAWKRINDNGTEDLDADPFG